MPSPPWAGPDLLDRVIELLLGLPPSTIGVAVAVFAAIENIFPPLPADTAIAVGAFLAANSEFSIWAVFGATWFGNVTAAAAVYVASRRIGRPFFQGRTGQRLLNPTALKRIEELHRRFGTAGIFLSRFIPGVRAVVPPFAGIAGVPALRAVLPIALASAIWYGAITYAAATLVRNLDDVLGLVDRFNRAGLVAGGALLVIGAVVWWLLARRRARD